MAFIQSVKRRLRSAQAHPSSAAPQNDENQGTEIVTTVDEKDITHVSATETGVKTVEAAQVIWGKSGRWLIIAGLALIMIVYEIDNSTTYIYQNYATSSFNALSTVAALSTASNVLFAAIKPPIAKLSNVMGRGETYILTMLFYILSDILMATAKNINTYAAGTIFHTIGMSGANLMNDIIISDITTARWRAFAIGVSFTPFLVTTWCSAFIVDSAVSAGGIGWRWGIGMLAILMPVGVSLLVVTLLHYQRRAKKMGLAPKPQMTLYDFCSQIDLGGIVLFVGGLSLLLVPMTLAATSPDQWRTPYLDVLIAIGGLLLILLPFYEKYFAKHAVVPPRYFRNRTVLICLLAIAIDSLGFQCTHTYLYSWGAIAHNLSVRDDTFYTYTNGTVQCLVGILAGLVMAQIGKYKSIAIAGTVVRTIGYGVMIRLRGATNSTGELFVVQAIQGIGSGMLQTTLLVPAQISVSHGEMAQMTALVVSFSFVGASVGSCIAGGIYTGTFKSALWKHLGKEANAALVNELFDSITGVVPDWGTVERVAVNLAYSDVLRYMTYTAFGASVLALILVLFLPDHRLPDRNNLVEE